MEPLNVAEFEALARERLPVAAFDYLSGGSDDELTLRNNRLAFEGIRLRPRVLTDVSTVSTRARLLGQEVSMPVLLAPAAFQWFFHPEGELAAARAAVAAGTILVASTFTSASMEEIAACGGTRWFQLYCARERDVTRGLVQRAARNGYTAICLTVDVPRVGHRERDVHNRAQLPGEALPRNFSHVLDLSTVADAERGSAIEHFVNGYLARALTWDDVDWIRSITSLPLVLKGILTAEDARLALEHEVDGIIVSNHGGRQLDGAPASIEVLEEVVEAVQGRAEVLLDSGVRRGTDVLKAIGLGASAVLVGRPYLWGLSARGEAGVRQVLELLRNEIEVALALLGCSTVAEVSRRHVSR